MLKKIFLFFLFSFFLSGFLYANEEETRYKMDSLIAIIQSDSTSETDRDRVQELINKILEYAEELNDIPVIFEYNKIHLQFNRNSSIEVREKQLNKMTDLMNCCSHLIPKKDWVQYYLILGYDAGVKGGFSDQLHYYLLADTLSKIIQDTLLNRLVDKQLIGYYFSVRDIESCLEKSFEILDKYFTPADSLDFSYLMTLGEIAGIYYYLDEYDSSIFYYKRCIRNGIGDYHSIHYEYLTLGRAYLKLNELDSASIYLKLAKDEAENKNPNSSDMIGIYVVNAQLHSALENYNLSVKYSKKAIELSNTRKSVFGLESSYKYYISNSLKVFQNKKLLDHFEIFISENENFNSRENLKIEKLNLTKYESLKKESEIIELQIENEAKELEYLFENQINAKKKMILIIGLIGTVVFSLLLISWYRRRQLILKQKVVLKVYKKETATSFLTKKEKELNAKINALKENNKIIEQLKKELQSGDNKSEQIDTIIESLNQNYISDKQWDNIEFQFNGLHPSYIGKLKSESTGVTKNDIRLALLLKLGYNNNSISEIFNISYEGVRKAKQRLNKKINDFSVENIL